MKKLAIILGSLLVIGATSYGKEMYSEPAPSKEVMVEPVVVEEIVPVIVPWGYVELRGGWDFWSEYDSVSEFGNQIMKAEQGDEYFKLGKDTDESGYEFALEVYKHWNNFDLGIGLAYQNHANRETLKRRFEDNTPTPPPAPETKNGNYYEMIDDGGEYKSIPVYLVGKYRLNYWDWSFTPYLKAMVGYSFNFDEEDIILRDIDTQNGNNEIRLDTDVDDGWYWAAGVGMEYKNFTMDITYGINYAEMDWKDPDGDRGSFDNDYERVTLSVGYKFNIW